MFCIVTYLSLTLSLFKIFRVVAQLLQVCARQHRHFSHTFFYSIAKYISGPLKILIICGRIVSPYVPIHSLRARSVVSVFLRIPDALSPGTRAIPRETPRKDTYTILHFVRPLVMSPRIHIPSHAFNPSKTCNQLVILRSRRLVFVKV